MKKLFFFILLIFVGIVTFFIYYNSAQYIKNQEWKYSNGMYIGDWLNQSNIEINNRIIKGKNAEAKIVFCFGHKLILKNIENGETGHYVNKN
ncbi:MAG TPA: hypothetical protein PLL09_02895 [Flavobacterium sp.]|uniref:hypothetical protein n=1 Tax=unclassified Flavobacterium TaxID=196869 RepID=UPI0025C515D2|nr:MULTISPECIES: hypothetical protein [unclassified Flavobacterium]HRE76753.1 hypothetical protein [Flavobacterium sp.]